MKQRTIHRGGVYLLVLVMVTALFCTPAMAADISSSDIKAPAAFIMDAATGEELWSKNADTELVPASLTKIMTAYLVYEAMDAGQFTAESVVPISSAVSSFSKNTVYSNVPLYTSQTYTVDELMDAMIITSACAASQALAEMVAGTEADFVVLMNETAQDLDINCSFQDCYGGSKQNVVTARGMAQLTYHLIKEYPDYLRHSQKSSYVFHGKTYYATNQFITGTYSCNGTVDGVKTGTTSAAGSCLVATAYTGEARVIAVVMKASYDSYRYKDGKTLLNYGLDMLTARLSNGWAYAEPGVCHVTVDDVSLAIPAYFVHGEACINPADLAVLLDGTSACFNVACFGPDMLSLKTKTPRYETGTEFTEISGGTTMLAPAGPPLYVDETETDLPVYTANDRSYVPLVALAELLGAEISIWAADDIAIMTQEYVAPFVDVAPGSFYSESVAWATQNEIVRGTTEITFAPDQICTRAQAVTILWRAAGEPEPTIVETAFTDIIEYEYYYKAVLWAVEEGITKGTSETTFEPGLNCTRAQIVTFLYRFSEEPDADISVHPFTDLDEIGFYYDAVLWAVEDGITNGTTETTFEPDEFCTRGQAVTFLHRLMDAA